MDPSSTTQPAAPERDAQRAALRDLVTLCADAAAAETQIQQTHGSQIQAAQKQLQTALAEIEQRNELQKQNIQSEYEQRVTAGSQQYEKAVADLQAQDSAARQKIEYEIESLDQKVRSELQHAIWLAESVFEATQNQIAKEYKKAKEDHAARMEELSGLMNESSAMLKLYGQPNLVSAVHPEAPKTPPGKYDDRRDEVKQHLAQLEHLRIPRLLVGILPFAIFILVCVIAMVTAQLVAGGPPQNLSNPELKWLPIGYAFGGAVMVCMIGGILLRVLGRAQVRRSYIPLRDTIELTRGAADTHLQDSRNQREAKTLQAERRRDVEIQAAKDKVSPIQTRAHTNRETATSTAKLEFGHRSTHIEEKRTRDRVAIDQWRQQSLIGIEQVRRHDTAAAQARHDEAVRQSRQQHDQSWFELQNRWQDGLERIQTPIERNIPASNGRQLTDWLDPRWQQWTPPKEFPSTVRFGQLGVDMKQITDRYPRELDLPPSFAVPAALSFPAQASMLIHTDHAKRLDAVRIQQMLMARLLTQLPAGRVRFTIIDPVGLGQNFAGFMHLSDHDEALVGTRIWTETEHIEQQLANLTEHMETVIQKYLRNEFATIDDYNAQAGELAEPYRYLIIADFPIGFEGDAFRRLNSIATSGARCGVFFIIVRDTRHPLPSGVHLDELESHSINLVRKDDGFMWKDEIFKQFPLSVDPPPGEEFLTGILDVVGRHAKLAKRVEVPFEAIAPPPDRIWSRDSKADIEVPIGRLGATRLQMLRLGRGVAQHALIAGKTGSGKSTLLHVLVTNLALWYGPDQVEFYLVDFKKGVEFKTYATHLLPHARAIAVESDREFGLSVLQRIDAELARRGEMFRKLGTQDLAGYRQASGKALPRTLLIIDEFQEFFSEDDKLAQEASLLLDRLVRQGRAFGIHVLLGSQTIGGSSGLARSTLGQMAVRIALQTSEADSQLILGDTNSAARLLSRPGEAIYNDAGGLVEGNSPFQISWLADEQREVYLDRVRNKAQEQQNKSEPIIFEGNAPADITRNKQLTKLLNTPAASRLSAPLIWLGDPVAIKDPTAIAMRQQSGSNVMIVGQYDESAMALMASAMISLAAQHPPGSAKFYLLDGTPADSILAGALGRVAQSLPIETKSIDWRNVPDAIIEIAQEIQRRQSAEQRDNPGIYLFICGLQRYRMLRKSEESFGFSMDEGEKKPQPEKLFADILREGPAVGVHVIAWTDTAASIERTFDRGAMREFDHRVLFQMSATDSSNLIDSPAANKLGFNRALAYSEELGVMEKFRPYALPEKEWLEHVRVSLQQL